jgi:methionyl-tRNA synthetase
VETVAHVSILISPVIPNAASKIQAQLGWNPPAEFTLNDLRWGMLSVGHQLGEGVPIFPKIELTPA